MSVPTLSVPKPQVTYVLDRRLLWLEQRQGGFTGTLGIAHQIAAGRVPEEHATSLPRETTECYLLAQWQLELRGDWWPTVAPA